MAAEDGSEGREQQPEPSDDAPAAGASVESEAQAPEEPAPEEAEPPPPPAPPLTASATPRLAPPPATPRGAAWGEPIFRFERRWTWLETRLITVVLLAQICALVAWVFLVGLASPVSADSSAGTIFRAVFGGAALGAAGWLGTRRRDIGVRRAATFLGLAVGIVIAPMWRGLGVDYFDNLRAWLQEGSTLTLMGGLRGLATRLTLWLALLGASLATSAGKHIHVDLLFRLLPVRLRLPAAVLNYCAAALVCLAAVWGFFDHIAIESFGSRAEDAAGAKIGRVAHHVGDHAFLTWKQVGLDLRTMPRVLVGSRYDGWMTAPEWNAWVKGAGFADRYPPEGVSNLLVPDDSPPHVPLVISPDGEPTRGILVHDLGMVFPFGLLVIALRFLLRALLSLSGHVSIDPDEAHKEELRRASAGSTAEPSAPAGGV